MPQHEEYLGLSLSCQKRLLEEAQSNKDMPLKEKLAVMRGLANIFSKWTRIRAMTGQARA
jgi:hypothetical protein